MKMHLAVSAAVIALTMSAAGEAQASLIPILDSVTADGSDFLYTYTGQLAPDQGLVTGDELVLVDFQGYVAGSVNSALPDFVASISNTLPAGLLMTPGFTDSSSIPDLVFTYTGPSFQTSGGPYPTEFNFNGLSAVSTFGGTANGAYSAVAVKNSGAQTGTTTYNVGDVTLPAGVPEPAVWAMMLTGFFGVGYMMRSRRKTLGAAAQA